MNAHLPNNQTILSEEFYARPTVDVAQDLLGKIIVRKVDSIVLSGMIIETEAYCHTNDPASHAFCGKTKRNSAMFGPVGHAYVYLSYGIHHCFNIVAKDTLDAGAVLIRSIKPISDIAQFKHHRKNSDLKNLANGPGKLTQALKITLAENHKNLMTDSDLFIQDGIAVEKNQIRSHYRVGISKGRDKPWRFTLP